MKCVKLLLNIVDFSFGDTCLLAKLIESIIMGGLLIPIIYMWWKLSLLTPWVMKKLKSTQVSELKKVMMKKKWRKGWNYYIPKGKTGG